LVLPGSGSRILDQCRSGSGSRLLITKNYKFLQVEKTLYFLKSKVAINLSQGCPRRRRSLHSLKKKFQHFTT
jgi:hypothetical protein